MIDPNTAVKLKILKIEYPGFSLNSDPEIERYFELRKEGKIREAFAVYNTYLRTRYTDDKERVVLLKAYRCRDPQFGVLLLKNILQQADLTAEKIKKAITVLTDDAGRLDINDAYSVIKGLDKIITALSGGGDKYRALAIAGKMTTYAGMLSYRASDMQHVTELLRLYTTDSLTSITQFKQEKEEERRLTARKHTEKKQTIDFSSITFSQADKVRILISPSLSRPEDKVITYCIKYWNNVSDAAFEKIIYLYSRKHNSIHYSVFLAIKNGRIGGRKDEEILNAVLSVISSGYYYNIRGDLYLQAMWKRMKERFIIPSSHTTPVSSLPLAVKQHSAYKLVPSGKPAEGKMQPGSRLQKKKIEHPVTEKIAQVAVHKESAASVKKTALQTRPQKQIEAEKAEAVSAGQNTVSPHSSVPKPSAAQKRSAIPESPLLQSRHDTQDKADSVPVFSVKDDIAAQKGAQEQVRYRTGSVSDFIKKLSSLSYDLYKDLFFAQVRPAIRSVLAKNRIRRGLFENRQNEAEETIFVFLQNNYDNPYMDWKHSSERKMLESLGYALESILPIIHLWYKERQI